MLIKLFLNKDIKSNNNYNEFEEENPANQDNQDNQDNQEINSAPNLSYVDARFPDLNIVFI